MAGTTWIQELIWLICNDGDITTARSLPEFQRVPYLEVNYVGIDLVIRLRNTHIYMSLFIEMLDTIILQRRQIQLYLLHVVTNSTVTTTATSLCYEDTSPE